MEWEVRINFAFFFSNYLQWADSCKQKRHSFQKKPREGHTYRTRQPSSQFSWSGICAASAGIQARGRDHRSCEWRRRQSCTPPAKARGASAGRWWTAGAPWTGSPGRREWETQLWGDRGTALEHQQLKKTVPRCPTQKQPTAPWAQNRPWRQLLVLKCVLYCNRWLSWYLRFTFIEQLPGKNGCTWWHNYDTVIAEMAGPQAGPSGLWSLAQQSLKCTKDHVLRPLTSSQSLPALRARHSHVASGPVQHRRERWWWWWGALGSGGSQCPPKKTCTFR